MRAALAALPDGTWPSADVLDSAGPRPEQQTPTRIVVDAHASTATTITFDFTGTDAQRPGNVNAVEAVTVSAVGVRAARRHRPDDPGQRRRDAPGRTWSRRRARSSPPVPPAAVGAGNVEVSQRVADVCLGALAQAAPDRVGAACQGTMNNVLIGGATPAWVLLRDGRRRAGRPAVARDGMSGVHTAHDQHAQHAGRGARAGAPVAGAALRLRRGSGGAGARPGGDGIERELEVLEHADGVADHRAPGRRRRGASPAASRARSARTGCCRAATSRAPSGSPDKCTVHLEPGDVLRMLTPGGGGWGPPTPSA